METKFVEKSADELKEMTEQEVQAYWVEKLQHEKSEMENRVKKLEESKDSEEIAGLKEEVTKLKDSALKTLNETVDAQGEIISKLRSGALKGAQVQAAHDVVHAAYVENMDAIKTAIEDGKKFRFEVKVAGDMTLGGNVSGGTMPQPQRLDGVNDIALRIPKTYDLIPKLTTDRNTIEWVYETNQDGTIDGTAEGTAKDQIDNDFVVTSVSLVKRAAYFKVSTEMLDDVSFISSWLRNKLIQRLFLDVDNQCLNGNGAGQNLNGVINQATAFAAGAFAGAVDNANNVDVLVVAANQIKIAEQPTDNLAIIMHPTDVAFLKLEKLSSTDKRYVERLMMVGSTLTMDGIPIIENTNITQGDYLIGDFGKATIVQKSSIEFEIGLSGDDFINNMRTLLAEWRGQLFIQNNDTTSFVTGDFATDAAALETP